MSRPDNCFGDPDEALSTRCGGQGVVVFYGMAKPVKATHPHYRHRAHPAGGAAEIVQVTSCFIT